jgi:hypothetical protein
MAKQNETGHAKNVANFESLVSLVTGLGELYNPSRTAIQLMQLNTTLENGKSILNEINSSATVNTKAIAAREVAFASLGKLATRVFNALKASGTPDSLNDGAQAILRKIHGVRASAKLTDEQKEALKAEGKEVIEKSSSQLSIDNRLNNFDKLIKFVTDIPEYAPNEAELSVSGLTEYYNLLIEKNQAVINSFTILNKARISRDYFLYSEKVGLVNIAADVKSYALSVFGSSNPQYKQLSAIKFKAYKTIRNDQPVYNQPNT